MVAYDSAAVTIPERPTTPLARFLFALALVVLVPGAVPPVQAQESEAQDPGVPEPTTVDPVDGVGPLRARLDELRRAVAQERATAALAPPRFERIVERLDAADATLDAVEATFESLDEWNAFAISAATRTNELAETLSSPPDTTEPAAPNDASLSDLEQRAQGARLDLEAARIRANELLQEDGRRRARRAAVPGELAVLADERDAIEQDLASVRVSEPGVGDGSAEGNGAARALALAAQLLALDATEAALTAELRSYDARSELLPKRLAMAEREVARAERLVSLWTERASTRRQLEAAEAARAAEAAIAEATQASATLGAIAERNAALAERRDGEEGLTAALDERRRAGSNLRERLDEVQRRARKAARLVEVGGVSQGVGDLLRRDLQWLPSLVTLRREANERRQRISSWQLEQLELLDERESVGDLGVRRQRVQLDLVKELGEARATELEPLVLDLLRNHQLLLDRSIEELSRLTEESERQSRLHATLRSDVRTYRRFIEERILWYPSEKIGSWVDGPAYVGAVTWLVSPATWGTFTGSVARGVSDRPERGVAALVLVLAWFFLVRRLRRSIEKCGQLARSFRTDRHQLTLRAASAFLAIVLPLPTAAWMLVALAHVDPSATTSTLAIARAIETILLAVFALVAMREAARAGGIGETIFRWRATRLAAVRRWVLRLGPAYILLSVVATILDGTGIDGWAGGPGRIAFIASQVVLFIGLRQGLREVEATEPERREGFGGSAAVRRLWSWLVLAIPIVLIFVSACGYGFAAVQLGTYYRLSLVLGLLVVLANAIALRWLFVARRRLAVERAQARVEAQAQAEKEGDVARDFVAIEEEDIDLPAVDAQTRQFIRSLLVVATVLGLYGIWSAGLPAVAVLDQVEIWPRFGHVESEDGDSGFGGVELEAGARDAAEFEESGDEGAPTGFAPGGLQRLASSADSGVATTEAALDTGVVTLADVFLALMVVLITTVATKNVPGLLEITLLKRLPLDSGARTAISTLVRYFILIVGSSVAFSTLGVGWDKVQWLAAALTFGLAFGLQEVFANFVSGIIILIERPIRVGDIVTVGGIEGRVTKLRMRATTIMEWDRKELLVPNKEFITSSVVNWTLTDPVTRVVIPVGVAYGSDIQLVQDQLRIIASANELVLDDPAPHVLFRSFGASSLDFQLRVFIASRDVWPELVNRLHVEIDAAFRKHGIEIAFPQLDLHLRDAVETSVRVSSRDGSGASDDA